MSEGIVVPIDIEALCVGENQNTMFLHKAYDFTRLPWQNRHDAQISSRLETGTMKPLGAGIHLHWALPDALTRGVQKEGAVEFPQVPDRWLVNRIYILPGQKASIRVRSWIVESNYATSDTPDILKNTRVPVDIPAGTQDPSDKPYLYLGRVVDASSWTESCQTQENSYLSDLTVIGYGEPEFSAFYPNCSSIFGFYDTVDDLKEDIGDFAEDIFISYQISGWYSTENRDIVKNIPPNSTASEFLMWTLPNECPLQILPDYTLYSGFVADVKWNPNSDYSKTVSDDIKIAVGYSPLQAMSALIKDIIDQENGSTPGLELILNALQLGMLSKHAENDWEEKLELAIHQNTFSSYDGGIIWAIGPKKPLTSNGVKKNETLTSSDTIAEELNSLNILQRSLDALSSQIDNKRYQIFSDWTQFMEAKYPLTGVSPILDISDTAEYILAEIKELTTELLQKQQNLRSQINISIDKINAELPEDCILLPTTAPRYWSPSEPTVLFYGDDVQPTVRYGGDGRFDSNGNLVCRQPQQLITCTTVKANLFNTSADITLGDGDFPQLSPSLNLPFLDAMSVLLSEACLLSPSLLATVLIQKGVAQGFEEVCKTLLSNINSTDQFISYSGIYPSSVAVNFWNSPWLPFSLRWQVDFYPLNDCATYSEDFILSQFELEAVDLIFTDTKLSNTFETYSGSIFLTPSPQTNMKEQIAQYVKALPTDDFDVELLDISKAIGEMPILAQTLSGFNDAMLMKNKTMQLEVGDPIEKNRAYYFFSNSTVKNAVGDTGINMASPAVNNFFNPISAGLMAIRKLTLVDVFGQTKELCPAPEKVIRAENMKQSKLLPQDFIYLPPRITQSSRLLFRFISTLDEMVETNEIPDTSPVCGWILCNYLDRSLMLYDADGTHVGALQLNEYSDCITWQNTPGGVLYDAGIRTALSQCNPHLREMAIALHDGDAQYLRSFMNSTDSAFSFIEPPGVGQDVSNSVLMGRPIAIVRAALNLELQGLAATHQGVDTLKNAIETYKNSGQLYPAPRDSRNFPSVSFPVYLGHQNRRDDGLVGFFKNNNYMEFYCSFSDGNSQSVIEPIQNTLLLSPKSSSNANIGDNALTLTLLMDPRTGVHATMGVLPQKYIEIPPKFYSDTLKNLALNFLVNPVLQSSRGLSLPVPSEGDGDWLWIENQLICWSDPVKLQAVQKEAVLNDSPQRIKEGWLKLVRSEK